MRGWVDVQNEKEQKMATAPSIQCFQGTSIFKPSAHLMGTGFQRFASSRITIHRVIISTFAQPNLENQIGQSFQKPAIAIHQNPY